MTQGASAQDHRGRLLLGIAAIGVVFGDIGTSPIYAVREVFHEAHGVATDVASVLGVLSLIFWSLVIVISIKYLFLVLRADNRGEGGIIALTALVSPPSRPAAGMARWLAVAGLFGAALLYGDSMITPAISVLSAVEGLSVVTPVFEPYIIPITVVILIALFGVQHHGTGGVGAFFGPVMLVWFTTLAVLGVVHLAQEPGVLTALSPVHAVRFFLDHPVGAFLGLGSVFLVVTGGEALYADLGHFGKRPIRAAWFVVVLPALLLNYFGQGALILRQPAAVEQPFFLMAPRWALYPLVGLTTVATVIASQAVISGAFSLTRQAVLLGYLPRLRIEHTSAKQIGQIYLPAVNWTLMVSCVALVFGFRTSSQLAGAYGVAVTTDMVFTTVLFAVVAWRQWGWPPLVLVPLIAGLLVVDLGFWSANLHKIPHGGLVPLLVAAGMFTVMTTWRRGRQILARRLGARAFPIELFVEDVRRSPPHRVPGVAVYMDSNPQGTPQALLHNLKHNHVLHERVILLTVLVEEVAYVPEAERFDIVPLGEGMYRLRIRVGFAEDVDIPAFLQQCRVPDVEFHPMKTTFVLGRERVISTGLPGMARWRERFFAWMSRATTSATRHFNLPPNRVVEIGMQVEI